MTEHYDVVIVGGGVVGAGVFRDAALHGLKCLLIDKKDFSSQTSQSSSKMLHGGIRYLETFDFDLVYEALHEKNFWLKTTPHLCQEKSFVLPVYNDSLRPLLMLKAGMWLYDFLSGFKNHPHKMISKSETISQFPQLRAQGLKGAGVYSDAIVDDAKLTLEVIYDAKLENDCEALNYHAMTDIKVSNERHTLEIKDELTGKTKTISCDDVVFALGPFTDKVLINIPELKWRPKLLPSKGSHIWIDPKKLNIKSPLVMTPKDGRVIFVIPQKDAVLVGTTELEIEGDFFDLKITQYEINYLLENLNEYFPNAELTEEDIFSSCAGVRPLIKDEDSSELGKTARYHKCYWPRSNVHVLMGGKYTTFRTMAQDVAENLCAKRRISYSKDRTKWPMRQKSVLSPFQVHTTTRNQLEEILINESARTFEDLVVRRMGIPGRKHWQDDQEFNEFFLNNLELINLYFPVTPEEIKNFQ